MKVAFAGPSIHPSNELRHAFPSVTWRPPARQGDVASAVRDGAAAIALIDGLYGTIAAVWHKEILFALSQGVRVIGGASLGALRAAECRRFGMEGVGAIFEDYAAGRRVDDGDVALLHGPEAFDFVPLTETLVDVEATLDRMVGHGRIPATQARGIGQAARATFFQDRTWEVVLARADLAPGAADRMLGAVEAHRVRAKRADALLVIDGLTGGLGGRTGCLSLGQFSATRSWRRIAMHQAPAPTVPVQTTDRQDF